MHHLDLLIHATAALPLADLGGGFGFLRKGGVFMVPLAIASVAGLMAILYKAMSLSRARVTPTHLEARIREYAGLRTKKLYDKIAPDLKAGNSTLARLAAVAARHKGKPRAEITQAVESSSREESAHLHAGIGVIDVVITVAPLLGLLGTASGLVVIFEGLGETTDYLAIARGIAEALSTTIAGLAIAVPCVIAHSYFTRRIELLTARMESVLSELTAACATSKDEA
ncbi:MAG: MotA/TolQ/ExbB proton channel family protein [Luteolibacter sp.]|jgi:biopolymer transport protein ExbB